MKELPICLERNVQSHKRSLQCGTWGSCRSGSIDLTCFLRYGWISQWHQHTVVLECVLQSCWRSCSTCELCDQRPQYTKGYYLVDGSSIQDNAEENARILAQNEATGFSRMVGSIDCMHWAWKTVHFLGKECIIAIKELVVWYLRPLQIVICGFGMLSSIWLDLTITSMYCSARMCSPSLLKVMLPRWSMWSMATSTPKGTTSRMAHLSNMVNICEDNLEPCARRKKSLFT
jgi:hypothetical protein